MKELSGSGFTVVGAGKSGIAAANVLAGRGAVARLVDDAPERARPPGMEEDGVRWMDDSKATNPNAASAALRAIDGPIVLLAGEADKGCSLDGLAALVRSRTRAAILFGAARHRLADAIGPEHPTIVLGTLMEAVSAARRLARTGDTMLLSPACSSFDELRSHAHRGEVFRALLRGVEVCDD